MTGLVLRTTGSWYKVLLIESAADSASTLQKSEQNAGTLESCRTQAMSSMVILDCRLRGNYRLRGNKQTNPVAVGDWVDFEMEADGTGVISEVHDRRNYIVRKATKLSKQTQVLASNIDRLCVVATLGFPRTSTGFIDRLLVTAEAYHIPACVVFNKADLYGEEGSEDSLWDIHNELKNIYEAAGYPVYAVSARTGEGLDLLRSAIKGQTVLFSGHSGVGKSSLLNALAPGLDLRVGEVSDWSLKGKHTTTFAEIFPIQLAGEEGSYTYLIDTPGIKEFGMVNFAPEELSHFFPEMRAVLHDCHFANCTHRHEPQCAVKQAVEEGRLSAERYNNYLGIYDQIEGGNVTR